jgi:hypothetical protein
VIIHVNNGIESDNDEPVAVTGGATATSADVIIIIVGYRDLM